MVRYEQLTFEVTQKPLHQFAKTDCCFDNEGHEINVGDYVVAAHGDAKQEGIEGIVKEIFFYEDSAPEIKITTYGGRVLKEREDPHYYVVKN